MSVRILIIEDEPLVALEIEQVVQDNGAIVAGMGHTLDEALELVERGGFDAAILDANLRGESAEPLISRVQEMGVPLLVVSGYTRDQLPFLDDGVPLMGKPFGFDALVDAIETHLRPKDLKAG